ncbi:hypothetical protein FSP39_003428 [Pinctada imbricata]|uniref:VWFA domain-containing protein n=1 Tax=Pinctada imbricata TaxID=66713 RepID=A0AA88XY24_PINIB|nr:hypothetical protein FSP39_003428 [Pinctada imbricata]
MLVLDESGSITLTNFGKMLTFSEDLVQSLNIGTGEAMIAFLTYSYSTRVHFDFNTYSTKTAVINAISNVDYSSGGTNTADALETARLHYATAYGKRDNALSLAIVLTDGKSNDKSSTLAQAQKLLDHGVTVYCIGIGSNLDEEELKAIASNPNDHYLISSTDFDELTTKITGLVESLCINNVIPTFTTCHMEIQDNNGEIAQSTHTIGLSSECKNQQDFYGKYQVHYASTNFEVYADISGLTAPTSAGDFAYGITDAKVQMIKKSITGQTFCLRYIADAGGYVEYNRKNYTYAKTTSTRDLCYYFDDVAPKHCKDTGTCSSEPLILSKEITRERNITVTFSGWQDPFPTGATAVFASGIKSYELYLYEMVDGAPGYLKMDTTSLIPANKCTCSSASISLPNSTHPALYAVVLEVVDIALNPRHARRFVFRDDVSKIAVHTHNTFGATSATNITGHKWQINHGDICFQWRDRFYNDKMVHFNPLNPIEPDPHNHFQGTYESTNGAMSTSGTPNVHGITDFYYSLYRDGVLVTENETITNFEMQSICLLPSLTSLLDGQTFVFRLLMKDLETCPSGTSDCYCPSVGPCHYRNFTVHLNSLIANNTHLGNHNRKYFIEVKVINIARLETSERVNILVDESPPEEGVVSEGSPGSVDIDYTSQQDLLFHWEGFIDHESGIKFYHVAVSDVCLTPDNITFATIFQELDGAESDYVVSLPKEGKYYVTVIAYNHAVMPSRAVCSDGITFDSSPPIIFNVTLQNARIPMASACYGGESWIVGPRGLRVKDGSNFCNFNCSSKNDVNLVRLLPEDIERKRNFNCDTLLSLEMVNIYLPDDHIHLYWNVTENESQLSKTYVGIGSNPSTVSGPDIIAYEEAKHLTFYKKQHAGIGNGDQIYIFIKAINKASAESTAIFGPLILDQSKPVCQGKPEVKVEY